MSNSKTIRTPLNYVTEIRAGSGMKPPTRAQVPAETEIERFAELTAKLARVSKPELDEKRQDEG